VPFKGALGRSRRGKIRIPAVTFIKKWVCNRPKDSYNLAERALIAIPEWLYPYKPAPLQQAALVSRF
jgi:hypothetical protein